MGLILDTKFIITAEREDRRELPGRIDRLLADRADDLLFITFTVVGELACGQSASRRLDWERPRRPYPVLPRTGEISGQYGEIYRALAAKGHLIGTNDMWIAATALSHGMKLVTNNQDEFECVPGLTVITY